MGGNQSNLAKPLQLMSLRDPISSMNIVSRSVGIAPNRRSPELGERAALVVRAIRGMNDGNESFRALCHLTLTVGAGDGPSVKREVSPSASVDLSSAQHTPGSESRQFEIDEKGGTASSSFARGSALLSATPGSSRSSPYSASTPNHASPRVFRETYS